MIKLQICCMVIILFIAAVYLPVKRVKSYSHILFSISLATTAFNLLFDVITVYTVNHLSTVPYWLNRACHILFLGSLIMEVFVCYLYSVSLMGNANTNSRKLWFRAIPVWIAWLGLIFMPIEYRETPQGNYSWGAVVFVVHGTIILYLILLLSALLRHWNEVESKKRVMITLAFLIQLIAMGYQAIFPYTLISSGGLTLINIAFFMTVESPDVLLIEKLKEEKERADEASEAKSQFLSNMSHEIRTPMNAIVGLTEVMLRKEWPAQEQQYLKNIKSSGDALLSLINDLLDFSKIESGKFVITEEDYDPLDMTENLKMIFENRAAGKDISLQYDLDPDIPRMLWGDGMRIRQIIINLVNNAIKFTDSGYVKLSMQVKEKREDSVQLCISVEDSGQGIRQEDLEKLFDAFTQVDLKKNHAKEGTGLGLAICKQLVELMGGELNVTSEYGKGSKFYFVLWQKSVSKETIGDSIKKEKMQTKPVKTEFEFTAPDAKVLLVDDNPINQKVEKALLQPLQMQIDVAPNGLAAYRMVQQKKYDLVFMDHYMPVMDGIEATQKIRELEDSYYKKLPILALTADAVAGEKEKFIEAGMNDVISKPIRMTEMCEKISYYLDEK